MITQAGALGDPFGTGVRTVWWVYGVGPVRIAFEHTGGETSFAQLAATTLAPRALPERREPDAAQASATSSRFRWRNDKHMKRWSTQRFEVSGAGQQHRAGQRRATSPARSTSLAQLRVHDPARRATTALSTVYRRGPRRERRAAAPGPAQRAGGPAALRHAVRPDDLRLQPGAARLRGQGPDLAQRGRLARLRGQRRHRRLDRARPAHRAASRPGATRRSPCAPRCARTATASAAAAARATSRRTSGS